MERLAELLAEYMDRDELIDVLQEFEPEELADICENLWVLKLVVSYCEARK